MVGHRIGRALREHAVSIAPTASTPFPPQVARSVDDARIVGLGEATHGTRECFTTKHGLVKRLVTELGFRTIAFEADAAAATVLDAYVRDGRDPVVGTAADADSALAELDMWQWQTESVRGLLDWLREFNAERQLPDQVRIRGVDLSTPAAPVQPLRAYFERVDPDAAQGEALQTVADATLPDDADERERTLEAVAAATATLAARLDANRDPYEAASSATAWQTASHLCRVVGQACEWARIRHREPGPHPDGMAARDRFMAENALWALERDSGAGVALWAHDGHVQRGTFDDGTPWEDVTTMGDRLARELGDDYRPVGFDFASGSFRAVGVGSGDVETFTVGEPPADSATAAFAAVDDAPYLLDLRGGADDPRLDGWLTSKRRTRYVGSVFDPDAGDGGSFAWTVLPASYDWLLVLPESTPTRPIGETRGQNA
ncbi:MULTISPECIES: erythromycin esterase family protein [Halolamina]|uniref:Erythromycin esterase n=1 Tax=Halolamina pelagica TaxID=699431 RepID=A0A1I5P4K1_9EURY|nr:MULTISPECIES: erythromycin esterase family protein [Halolamina]NHX36603.1 erythromycin esterase family protein [Halolamina sp. R1-12]SFP28451.1 erythromycin esterase [Halolamina pelagica]